MSKMNQTAQKIVESWAQADKEDIEDQAKCCGGKAPSPHWQKLTQLLRPSTHLNLDNDTLRL